MHNLYLIICNLLAGIHQSKIPCNGKTETELNIRLNNHQKDVWKPDATPESLHFSGKSYNFNTHAKFILIGQIFHIDIDKKNKERIKKR